MLTPTKTSCILETIAAHQFGLVHLDQARARGVGPDVLRKRAAAGRARCEVPKVYRLGAAAIELCEDGRRLEPVLWGGPGSALSHESAIEQLITWKRTRFPVHVTIPGRGVLPRHLGIEVHRGPGLAPDEIIVPGKLPITIPERACCDAAANVTPFQLARIITLLVVSKQLTIEGLAAYAATRGRVAGVRGVRRAIELHRSGSAGTRSLSEDWLLQALLALGAPEPLVNVRGATGIAALEVDLVWPHQRLVVEIDGEPFHSLPGAHRLDEARTQLLVDAGWRVYRVWSDRVKLDRATVVREIVQLLGV